MLVTMNACCAQSVEPAAAAPSVIEIDMLVGPVAPAVSSICPVVGLKAAVADYTPERVAPMVGLDAAVITGLADDLAAAPTAAVYGRMGTCTQEFGSLASWLVDVVNALTGNLDSVGGAMLWNQRM